MTESMQLSLTCGWKFFFFCGSSCGPTSNNQYLAKHLVTGDEIPLGKYLLRSAYSLLHQVSVKLLKNELIGMITGPWWLIQLWLNLYMHRAVGSIIRNRSFPSSDLAEGTTPLTRRCMSFGKASSAIFITTEITQLFMLFYNGLTKESYVWFAYDDPTNEFELPIGFRFDTACQDGVELFKCMIHPSVLPVDFRHGHTQ